MSTLMLEHGDDLQFALFFVLFALLAVVEAPASRRKRWPANLGLTALNVLVLSAMPVGFLAAAQWAEREHVGLLHQFRASVVVMIAANLLARAFISFFTHLLMHRFPPFWAVHRVHHLDTELDVSTTVRFHPLEFAIGLVPGIPLVVLLGLEPWVLMLYELLDVAVTLFSHANVRLSQRLDRLLRYVIVTPSLHRVHHSSWQPETDSNFGAVFPVWDLIFGTFRTGSPERLGLDETRDARTTSVRWLLASPF
jgi:sterol desaturase/sphingolipid hydroxylase (fatty acid hydroxylase superfamily)